jgi:amidase
VTFFSSLDDALGDDDATGLRARLTARAVSPAELLSAAYARLAAAEPILGAVAWQFDEPPTSDGTTAADAPFAGIPSAIKDNDDVRGAPTTQGSWALAETPASAHSPWVAQFLALGAVPIAKTTMPEFGLTATTESTRFGPTRNPWHVGHTVGGSSGGSAALVAAGVVPIAHANDGGGSIRIPAACCGLVGLKPSRGRLVDRPDLARLPVPIGVPGVLTRTVRDTARYYAAVETLAGVPGHLPPVGDVRGPGRDRRRIGLVLTPPNGLPVDPESVAAVRRTAMVLEDLGHHVVEVPLPVSEEFAPDFLRYWALLAFGLQHGGRRAFGAGFDGSRTEAFTRGLAGLLMEQAPLVPGALRRLRRIAAAGEAASSGVDVLLSPTVAHPAPPIGWLGPDVPFRDHLLRLLRFTSFTPLQNVTGEPAISLPVGRSHAGLPIGAQLAAPVGHERRLLELAYELEEASPWPLVAPQASWGAPAPSSAEASAAG